MTRTATIYFQCAVVIFAAANQMADIFPPFVQKYVPFVLLCLTGIQAVIAHGYYPNGTKIVNKTPGYIAPRDLPEEDK